MQQDGFAERSTLGGGALAALPARLAVTGAYKAFPGVHALTNVSLEVQPAEVHALVGENGAGKSTLMRIVAGVEQPEAGEIRLDGEELVSLDEHRAGELGISMVHQERSLVAGLSIAENVFAARQPTRRFGLIRWRQMAEDTRQVLHELRIDLDPDAKVASLAPAHQQVVEIAKALSRRLRLLILDEPTAALSLSETKHLFETVRHLKSTGVSVIYISHRLAEVFELADRVTVLKDGRVTGSAATANVGEDDLIRMMVGRELSFHADSRRVGEDARVVLDVRNVSSRPAVHDASLTVRAGEIVCLAGLIGAGRSELCEAIFGVRPCDGGSISFAGEERAFASPAEARRAGIGMVPEDRKEAGLFLEMSVTANIASSNLGNVTRWGLVKAGLARNLADTYVTRLRIATPSTSQPVVNLSGGNQQRVLLAKWLAGNPRVLIVDEPTRGVDVGARAEIYALLRQLAESGMGLLVVSSDLPEVLTIAHRIVVMREGRTVAELDAATADEESILRRAALIADPAEVR